jgi:hypothetical protein
MGTNWRRVGRSGEAAIVQQRLGIEEQRRPAGIEGGIEQPAGIAAVDGMKTSMPGTWIANDSSDCA